MMSLKFMQEDFRTTSKTQRFSQVAPRALNRMTPTNKSAQEGKGAMSNTY